MPEKEIKELLRILTHIAMFDGPKNELSYRCSRVDDAIWIDLGGEDRQAVKVTKDGYRVFQSVDVPIIFRRQSHMKPLLPPVEGGSLEDFRSLIHVLNDDIWILLKVWLVTAFIPNIPRPSLTIFGLHGSGKSIAAKLLRSIIDPSEIPLLATPPNANEFALQLNNNYIMALDNVQVCKPWISDYLCRAVTGTGFARRKLYSNNDEIIFKYIRPFIINGMSNPVSASDLLDRSILIGLDRIPKESRLTESGIIEKFYKIQPFVFGAILKALSETLRTKDNYTLPHHPRMADCAQYGFAAAEALGIGGERFLEACAKNDTLQHEEVIENDLVASTVKALAQIHGRFVDTPSRVYQLCKDLLEEDESKSSDWPKNTAHFSRRLKIVSNNLRELSILVEFSRGKERNIAIKYTPPS